MSFLKSLFAGGSPTARREEDKVWMNDKARAAGVRKAVEGLRAARHSIVVVAPSAAHVEAVASQLESLGPGRVADVFSRLVLADALSSPGRVVVAAASALPADAKPADIPVDVLAWARSETRAADDAIAAFADRLGSKASIAFHVSLEDALLREQAARLEPILKALKLPEDEPLSSSMVSRSIEAAQRKNGK